MRISNGSSESLSRCHRMTALFGITKLFRSKLSPGPRTGHRINEFASHTLRSLSDSIVNQLGSLGSVSAPAHQNTIVSPVRQGARNNISDTCRLGDTPPDMNRPEGNGV